MESIERLYHRYVPSQLLGEILSKRWSDNIVPVVAAVLVVGIFLMRDPHFFTIVSVIETSRQLSEFAIVVVALGLVLLAGGLDLSVGSIFALSNVVALIAVNLLRLPVGAVFLLTLATGAVCGAVNGVLIGYLRIRAFLTTLVTLIIWRSVVDLLLLQFAVRISSAPDVSELWYSIGEGTLLGLPHPCTVLLRSRRDGMSLLRERGLAGTCWRSGEADAQRTMPASMYGARSF
jgi:ribose transport system permease protein